MMQLPQMPSITVTSVHLDGQSAAAARSVPPSSIPPFGLPRAGYPQPLPLAQIAHHQGTLHQHEDVSTTTSPQSGMDIPPQPPTVPDPFAFNPAGGSTFPPSTALNSNPPHQPGKVPSTGLSVPGHLPFQPFPPYGYGMPFPHAPPAIHGTSISNGYPPSHPQMPPSMYHPMMGFYYPPGYGQQPPPPMS